jgi:hypothetical protein
MPKIKSVELRGFKGLSRTIELTGRDLAVGKNFSGKSSLTMALEFLFTGSIQAFQRADLLGLCTNGRFGVTATVQRDDDSVFKVTRSFFEKSGGGTGIEMEFDPPGIAETVAEHEAALTEEFEGSSIVRFNLHDFVVGTDQERLTTCLSLAPPSDEAAGPEIVKAAIESVQADDRPPGFEEVRQDLLNIRSGIRRGAIDRLEDLGKLLEKWRKAANSDVGQRTKAVRELGKVAMDASSESGVNLERAEEELAEAQKAVDELKANAAAGSERRRLIAEGEKALEKLRSEQEGITLDPQRRKLEEICRARETLEGEVTKLQEDVDLFLQATTGGKVAIENLERRRKELTDRVRVITTMGGNCALCDKTMEEGDLEILLQHYTSKIEEFTRQIGLQEKTLEEDRLKLAELRHSKDKAGQDLRTLDVMVANQKEYDGLTERIREKEAELGELAVDLPADLEADVIDGALLEKERCQKQVDEIKVNRQRFTDQEKLRTDLAQAEVRLKAIKAWQKELGLKGIHGRLLAESIQEALLPARTLVNRILPDSNLVLSWETPRGEPGLRPGIKRKNQFIPWPSLSGAEQAIVGTALLLTFASKDGPPVLLALEAETMDDEVEGWYLNALADLAGPSALVVTSHHGGDDMGIFNRIEFTRREIHADDV